MLAAAALPVGAEQSGQSTEPPPQTVVAAAPTQASLASRPCRALGFVKDGEAPLPGASVTAFAGEKIVAITSTDLDGSYVVPLAPGSYTLRVELTAFATVTRDVTVGQPPCQAEADMAMQLASRAPASAAALPSAVASIAPTTPAPAPTPTTAQSTPAGSASAAQPQGRGGRGGRGGPPRFQALTVQQSEGAAAAGTSGDAVLDVTPPGRANDPAAQLLPPGFSLDGPTESVAVSGSMVELDRGLLNDRVQALGRGEFGLGEGEFGQPGQALAQSPLGGLGGDAGGGRGGGGGGRGGGFGLGGRVGGANRLQMNGSYNVGGSAFDAAPYALRGQQQQKRDYLQQSFSMTMGGPLKIPHLYDGSRTNFNFSYSGNRSNNLFDQYATVPSDAFRNGDFSASPVLIIDPLTGQPFPGNLIPADRISDSAKDLLRFIPSASLDGDTRNFRNTGTSQSVSDSFSLRITHSFTQPQTGRGGRGGGSGRGGGAAGGRGAAPAQPQAAGSTSAGGSAAPAATASTPATGQPAGAAAASGASTPAAGTAGAGQPGASAAPAGGRQAGAGQAGGRGGRGGFRGPNLNVTMNGTITYRRNNGDRPNVYPLLSGATNGSTLSTPVSLSIRHGRSMHAINASFSRTHSTTSNAFAFNENVAGEAGIGGVSTDPFDWGVPTIAFGTFTSLRDVTPSKRDDKSFSASYTWSHPLRQHNLRAGGNYSQQWNSTQSDSNARGTFTFTGLYTAGGLGTTRGSGQDFADFLLGMPQQATRSYSVTPDSITNAIEIRGRSLSAFFQDDWRWKARWTINFGVQYEYIAPFTEANGRMVNLDVNSDFTAAVPVESGQTGTFTGAFPAGLVNADTNNVAPRFGVAWRASNRSVVRFGYGLSYNSGSYANIARQLYQQPPFFLTGTSLGTLEVPLSLADPFADITPSTVTNTYGIDKNYQLGLIHQWNIDYNRDLSRLFAVGATYIGTRGAHLDLLRAPNRGPDGLRIEDVQAFTWQSSGGSSHMNGVSFRLQKRQSKGFSANASYTLARSWDNTTATSGNATVAQDDRNLGSEWALSNFDRRHQFSASTNVELPWGRNRKWLAEGGWLAGLVGDWSMSANLTWQSGTPLTARCSTCASDVARGTGGTLRADYTGLPIAVSDPGIDRFFNTAAFSIPDPGTFGDSLRNVITGPGSHQLNAAFSRDVRLVGNRNVTVQVQATNLLNTVNYGSLDTNVNSPTFGEILSVRGMRTVRLSFRFRYLTPCGSGFGVRGSRFGSGSAFRVREHS